MKPAIRISLLCSLWFGLILGLASGYQIFGESRDYRNYFEFFDLVRYSVNISNIDYRFEPAFTAVVYLLTRLGLGNALIYCVIAGAVVLLKYYSINGLKNYWTLIGVFTFYFLSRYVILFEMTVLRAACAFALAFYVFFGKDYEKYKVKDIFFLALAALFHYSAIVFFSIYFVRRVTRYKIVCISLFVFCVIYFTKEFALSYLPNYVTVFSTYTEFNRATFLPIPFAIDICFLFAILYFWKNIDLVMRYCALGIALSISFHFALVDYSMLAGRFRELLSVFVLIYVTRASICDHKQIKYISLAYTFMTGLLHLYLALIYDPLLS